MEEEVGQISSPSFPLAVSQTDTTFSFLLVQAAIVFLLSSADIVNELLESVCKAALRKEEFKSCYVNSKSYLL